MQKKKFCTTYSTSLDQELSDAFMGQIVKFAPFESPSSVIRVAISLVTAIGLDVLYDKGLFGNNSS